MLPVQQGLEAAEHLPYPGRCCCGVACEDTTNSFFYYFFFLAPRLPFFFEQPVTIYQENVSLFFVCLFVSVKKVEFHACPVLFCFSLTSKTQSFLQEWL